MQLLHINVHLAVKELRCYKGRTKGEEKKLFCLVLKYSDQDQVGSYSVKWD